MSFYFALFICAVCFFLLGYRWGMRDRAREELKELQRIAKERDYWHSIAVKNKNDELRLKITADDLKKNL